MGFLKDLKDVYEANEHQIGKMEIKNAERQTWYMLLPIFHKTQKAHVEITLTESGDFVSARVIENGVTVIPTTIDSASRTNGIVPHPLHDKLIYLDSHYVHYLPNLKPDDHEKLSKYAIAHLKALEKWRTSSFTHPFIETVYLYLAQQRLMKDLISNGILILDKNGYLMEKWTGAKEEKPDIFRVVPTNQTNTFVRFRSIQEDNGEIYEPWTDPSLWDCHIQYQESLLEEEGLCYITGEVTKLITKHPTYIRNATDSAKLISTPTDQSFITYQGLFGSPEEVVGVGAITSLKAHNALKWLIEKQGYTIGESTYLVFGNGTVDPQQFWTELDALFLDEREENTLLEGLDTTESLLSQKLKALMVGIDKDIPQIGSHVTILCLDAATIGRLAITEYRQIETKLYFERMKKWQETASWVLRIKGRNYIGSPSIKTIIRAAYGKKVKDKLMQLAFKRLTPCILDGRLIPSDILEHVLRRALKKPNKDTAYEKQLAIDVACSLLKHNRKGYVKMTLDVENNNRSYLFGRLLAIAEYLEGTMINWERETNAERLMQMMYRTPARTWTQLHFKLRPYFHKKKEYKSLQIKCKKMIEEIVAGLGDDFNNSPLTPEFLVGYSTQKRDFFQKHDI